eukprot:GFUD01022424.1.p1 GENE.GFUD01022424.1~~GFUD01022424.1.p1  ORF type:complete len:368 (-),score=96.64 GFUD01022424.1:15-1118(-)
MKLQSILLSSLFLPAVWSGCPFQNPFWFLDRPSVVTVVDSEGEMVADRVRVSWGRLENFKCVDYFQIEYYEQEDKAGTFKVSEKINRHRRSHDIDIKPCRDYLFKVIASEDWQGTREDYRMGSDTISFRVDYTPKFTKPPIVKERRVRAPRPSRTKMKRSPRRRKKDDTTTTEAPTPEPDLPYNVWVSWKLSDIDWPMCLDYFEFDYYDTVYNESTFKKTFKGPFQPRMEFELLNEKVPCDEEYAFVARVYGLTGDHSIDFWTPPSCISTTPEPTTTTPTPPTTLEEEGALEAALDENEALKEKISGLKQHYAPIGKRVYEALKDSAYHSFESYLARQSVLEGGDIGQIQKLAEHSDDQDYAYDNLI